MTDLLPAMFANEARPKGDDFGAYDRLLEGLRLAIRQGQLDLIESPDPTSPWWFLVDPDAEFAA